MINNGVGLIRLVDGGLVKLDIDDYLELRKYEWMKLKKGAGDYFIVTKSGESGYFKYMHRMMGYGDGEDEKNKQLFFVNGDRSDYRRKNISFRHYVRRNTDTAGFKPRRKIYNTKKGKLPPLEGNIHGIIGNKAIIAINNERDLVCATCSLLDLDMYMYCLDHAAYEHWPGWSCLGGPHCNKMRESIEHADRLSTSR